MMRFELEAKTNLDVCAWIGGTMLLAMVVTGCADSVRKGHVTQNHPNPPLPTEIEGDAQGGVETSTKSQDFDIRRVSVGGSYSRTQVSSSHFKVTGGIIGPK